MTAPAAKGDRPRKIVYCHPDQQKELQSEVAKLGHGDVLVYPSTAVPYGEAYVAECNVEHWGVGTWSWEQP